MAYSVCSPMSKKYSILSLRCNEGQTVLHQAARQDYIRLIKWFLTQLETDKQRELMAMREHQGQNSATDIAEELMNTECFNVLGDFTIDANIAVILRLNDKLGMRYSQNLDQLSRYKKTWILDLCQLPCLTFWGHKLKKALCLDQDFDNQPEMCNLPFLRLLINHNYPVIHPDWIKQIDFKKLATLLIIHG